MVFTKDGRSVAIPDDFRARFEPVPDGDVPFPPGPAA
jgi:hypothetical protein